MDFKFKTLLIEEYNQYILIVKLNHAPVNAINSEMMRELNAFWHMIIKQSGDLRCIILTGVGNTFCAGADIKERNTLSIDVWKTQHLVLRDAMGAMMECSIPIIAAVNGAAFGGGLELVLASDFAYASETATFSQSEVKLGIIPGALGTQTLPRSCGLKRAKELALSGDIFTAQEAHHWEIINKVCKPADLMPSVLEKATIIANNAPLAIQYTKNAINQAYDVDLSTGSEYELKLYHRVLTTKDREEGIRAFNEKRKPNFTGE
jgi:enoyl-CoA hydratase/carnithine racemase